MKITKFEHACFVVEHDGAVLVVDPGGWTTNLVVPNNVVAVVITHAHPDHIDPKLLTAMTEKNPDAVIIADDSVTNQLKDFKTQPVVANEGIKVGSFELEFFGGQHAIISPDIPTIANLGVLINDTVYYPGDSFALPDDRHVAVLALPVSAPWMKFSEAAEFITKLRPAKMFPTHDAILSPAGKSLADTMFERVSDSIASHYQRIDDTPLEA
ncbi:MAG: hypothetical protein QG549_786 [Patescibacteria group bacterium]|nr:hypothetical protein [Patescibacteria group bacterium]